MKLNVYLFLKKDDELLEKYIEIWENVKNWIKIIDSEPVYNEKCLKAPKRSTWKISQSFWGRKRKKVSISSST